MAKPMEYARITSLSTNADDLHVHTILLDIQELEPNACQLIDFSITDRYKDEYFYHALVIVKQREHMDDELLVIVAENSDESTSGVAFGWASYDEGNYDDPPYWEAVREAIANAFASDNLPSWQIERP